MKVKPKIIVETDRLQLEEVSLRDGDFIIELLNSPGWLAFIGDRNVRNKIDAQNYIKDKLISGYRKNGFGLYKVSLKEGAPIGLCGLLKRETLSCPDIGYALLPQYERKGYMFEAAKAIVELGLKKHKIKTILGITSPDNQPSKLLLEKLGFKFQRQDVIPPFPGESAIFSINN